MCFDRRFLRIAFPCDGESFASTAINEFDNNNNNNNNNNFKQIGESNKNICLLASLQLDI
jgi:hypothetical protein